ncbi:MAG: DUF4124 domain-containing protein [Burkholderiales bacterium]
MRLLLAAALALALPLHAETYKWVDEKGVTHYSSTPPAGATKVKLVEERVSVVPSDPSLQTAIADMRAQALRRQDYVEQEYLQRQRLSAEKEMLAMTLPACPYRAECGDGDDAYAYPGYGYAGYPAHYGGAIRARYGRALHPAYHRSGLKLEPANDRLPGPQIGRFGAGRR